MIDRW